MKAQIVKEANGKVTVFSTSGVLLTIVDSLQKAQQYVKKFA